ncbi:MAG: hypothetical protein HYV37_00220 [Candidatus Levyibacteriota bacterium]|nr:MAG: hypothetical protein HYV37_00220 [Candidatus Levybacteria bacterium]
MPEATEIRPPEPPPSVPSPEAAPESNPMPEKTRQDVQQTELRQVTNATIRRKANELAADTGNSQQTPETIRARNQIKNLDAIRSIASGNHKTNNDPNGIDFTDGNPAMLTINGEQRKLLYIESADDETFTCRVEGVDDVQTVARSAVFDAQLLSEADAILSQFPKDSPERAVLEMQINILKDPDHAIPALGTAESAAMDAVIIKGAESNGMLTINDLLELHKSIAPQDIEQQTAFMEVITRAAEQGNLLNFETVVEAFSKAGVSGETIQQTANEMVEQAKEAVKRNPTKETTDALAQAETQAKILSYAAQALAKDGPLQKFMEQTKQGAGDLETAKTLIRAVRSGNVESVIAAIPGTESMSEEDRRKIAESVNALRKKGGSGGLLIMLFMLGISAIGNVDAIYK